MFIRIQENAPTPRSSPLSQFSHFPVLNHKASQFTGSSWISTSRQPTSGRVCDIWIRFTTIQSMCFECKRCFSLESGCWTLRTAEIATTFGICRATPCQLPSKPGYIATTPAGSSPPKTWKSEIGPGGALTTSKGKHDDSVRSSGPY